MIEVQIKLNIDHFNCIGYFGNQSLIKTLYFFKNNV